MTSRESTSWGGRADEASAKFRRTWKDRLLLGAFYVLNGPFLAKSLYGGSKKAKRALLERLDLPLDALPHTGSWKADVGLLTFLTDHILAYKPRIVVKSAPARPPSSSPALWRKQASEPRPCQLRTTCGFLPGDDRLARIVRAEERHSPRAFETLARWLARPVVRPRAAAGRHRIDAGRRPALGDPPVRAGGGRHHLPADSPRRHRDARRRRPPRRAHRRPPLAAAMADFSFKLCHPGSKGTLVGTRRR